MYCVPHLSHNLAQQVLSSFLADPVGVVWLHVLANAVAHRLRHKALKVSAGLVPGLREVV